MRKYKVRLIRSWMTMLGYYITEEDIEDILLNAKVMSQLPSVIVQVWKLSEAYDLMLESAGWTVTYDYAEKIYDMIKIISDDHVKLTGNKRAAAIKEFEVGTPIINQEKHFAGAMMTAFVKNRLFGRYSGVVGSIVVNTALIIQGYILIMDKDTYNNAIDRICKDNSFIGECQIKDSVQRLRSLKDLYGYGKMDK